MSPAITMTEAITALVTEKRATGYKYHAEERVLTRFAVFAAAWFPGQQAPTRGSVEAWIAPARRRGVTPATLHALAAPVRELARWPSRRGVAPYVLPAAVLARMLGIHISVAVAWQRASSGDGASYAAAVSRRDPH